MSTKYIQLKAADGSGSFRGYLAIPASGAGPGLVIAQEIFGINKTMREVAESYAEEGYVALVPDLFWRQTPNVELGYSAEEWKKAFELYGGFDEAKGMQDIQTAITALRSLPEVTGHGVGVLGFCLGGKLAYLAACRTDSDVSVGYYGVGIEAALAEAEKISKPLVLHIAAEDKFSTPEAREAILRALKHNAHVKSYVYPGTDHAFARVGGDHYHRPSALMAHERSIAALKDVIGPNYDLSALWDKHCEYEFGTRNVDDTMSTMVAEPYVNHIPTMTGGVGYKDLHRFYSDHFVNSNPPDTTLTSLSRTVGATQVVDELLFSFTHTTQIPWMLPNVAPTGKRVEVPLVVVINFRGDKLYHEHIYWDQASVLVQVGLLDPTLLPVAGVDQARKLLDEQLPSNALITRQAAPAAKVG
jgi:carboxymethylenebutenolidase